MNTVIRIAGHVACQQVLLKPIISILTQGTMYLPRCLVHLSVGASPFRLLQAARFQDVQPFAVEGPATTSGAAASKDVDTPDPLYAVTAYKSALPLAQQASRER